MFRNLTVIDQADNKEKTLHRVIILISLSTVAYHITEATLIGQSDDSPACDTQVPSALFSVHGTSYTKDPGSMVEWLIHSSI
jgi:hypothetical protein